MAQNKTWGQVVWNRIPRTIRNAIDPRNWGGAIPWNRQSTQLSTTQDLDLVDLQPREYYVGQLFAAIRTRANRVADLAKEHTETRYFDDPEKEVDEDHPYLTLINESPNFPNTYFWKALSTFLDLPGGCAYIYALRNYTEAKDNKGRPLITGETKEFQIVNPYRLTKVLKQSDQDTYRYIEQKPGGAWREIPEEQLIIVRSFNPFSMKDGYSMAEAVTDDQFSIQQARSYTRQAIRDNVGQRGMLSPSVVMQDEDYTNFENAVNSLAAKGKGKFMTTNAPVTYTDMQIDLDKLALATINKISMDTLIAVTGTSKTLLGIEESGTTRETARVQRDLFTENHAIPQLTDILDALNQDYKNSYPTEYEQNKVEMYVDSPLKVDKDADFKESQTEKLKIESAKIGIDAGYDPQSVTDYFELEDLEFEERQLKEKPKLTIKMPGEDEQPEEDVTDEDEELNQVLNQFSPGLESTIKGFETTLANQVTNIEGQVLQALLPKLGQAKNALNKDDEDRLEKELAVALAVFTGSLVALFGTQTIRKRLTEHGLGGNFTVTPSVTKTIKAHAARSATSHIETFTKAIFEEARKATAEGLGREAITSRLTSKWPDIAKWQATRVARTESYKAVNLAQYEADKQFLAQNKLTKQAYKKWVTQSKNPCPYCIELSKREPVPFGDNFLDVGDSIKAEFEQEGGTVTREYVANFEPVGSGTAHPNCSCTYELIIK